EASVVSRRPLTSGTSVGLVFERQESPRQKRAKALSSSNDLQLLDLGRDLLHRLELLQSQEDGLLRHDLRRVGEGTRRGGLLAAENDLGSCFLFGLDDLVEQRLHLAGEHDVLDADAIDTNAERTRLGGRVLLEEAGHRITPAK